MRFTATILFAVSICASMPTLACSFTPGYETFQFVAPNPDGIGPETPVLTGYKVTRGFDDGNFASCSDAGVIELYFERTHGVGYLFEPLEAFEDSLFPEEIVQMAEGRDHFFFVWLDGAHDQQEPINLTVRVTAYYPNGQSSAPIEIRIIHVGGRHDA